MDINQIKPHPLNSEIYKDTADQDLIESIQKVGVLNPLLITKTGIIISGHRRYYACKALNLDSVPVIISDLENELDIIEALIISNKQRDKTTEQKAREYRKLKEIEEIRAKERQALNALNNQPQNKSLNKENVPYSEKQGQSRDIAAAKIGMSGKNAEKANEVIAVIDNYKETGATEKAEALTDKLNKSVNGAYTEVKAIIDNEKKQIEPIGKHTIEEIENNLFIVKSNNPKYKSTFNATNDSIEWAKWTWNPLTGCLHGCQYCYAKAMAENSYYKDAFPVGFKPAFYPDRLKAVESFKIPESRKTEPGITNVFVCSMADIMGAWNPNEWIQSVIDTMATRPDLNFLLLTKNPGRYADFEFSGNVWLGATADNQVHFDNAIKAFNYMQNQKVNLGSIWFLSCEPLLEDICIFSEITSVDEHSNTVYYHNDLDNIDWIIVGGLKNSENQPEWTWVENLLVEARKSNCQVYFKPNLTIRPMEYPI